MELIDLTFSHIVEGLAVLIVCWFVVKNFIEIRKVTKDRVIREESWDTAAKVIKEKEKKWDDGLATISNERKQIIERYDGRLDEIETRIDENHSQTEAKIQEVQSEIYILTECMRAVLDGLHQQGCNGEVTKTKQKLETYLIKKAYDEDAEW